MNETADHKAAQSRKRAEREARRRAELMANMARRKAQLRGRAAMDTQGAGDDAVKDERE